MPNLIIDNREVEIEPGSTILDAARKLGIEIPTLCFRDGCDPSTSCMVCVVSVNGRLAPSCATVARDGIEVESETDEVHEARRTALELLLSDHLGDCMAPCHRTCPAGMDIPLMLRQIASHELRDAIVTVKADIALPAVLGRICSAPCENGCRRGVYDSPVSICLLKRYVADVDLASESPYLPSCEPDNGKRVAVVGAGPTGLAAAYYLLQEGYSCKVFDDHEQPGGMLRYGVTADRLPHDVLDEEIEIIKKLGAEFQMETKIGEHLSISDLQRDYDAVLIASGNNDLTEGMKTNRNTLQSDLDGVFVGGNATGRKSKMAVRSVADGKSAAISINQYLSDLPVMGPGKPFTVSIGRLIEGEIDGFMKGVNDGGRISPDLVPGFSESEADFESIRCLHCDCRAADHCKLRDYSGSYEASSTKYKDERKLFEQIVQDPQADEPLVIYEPGKCIKCGLCIQIASRAKETLGLTFIGRGFDVRVDVPFNRSISEGLQKVAAECVDACPTGSLEFK
ncbi:2Fe-2S iron-sulfur cluster-binding protein [Candidatus Poribacteria bacterium]